MSRNLFEYHLQHCDSQSAARMGTFFTPHGAVETPAFMPVGTQGTVKGLTVDQLRSLPAQMILGNTYHLALRPGADVIESLGGLHRFMGWNGPILTDSGGFQLFSLAQMTQVSEAGATFRSHIDGSLLELTPEHAIRLQEALGSDVAMVLDHVVGLPNPPEVVRAACERSVRWADRCRQVGRRSDQVQFAIVQGGLDSDLRVWCAEQLIKLDFFGYAIGGLSVGESQLEMLRILDVTCPVLPDDRPRYLMGVGTPADILQAIGRGIDLFDCVMPTRNARNAQAFTDAGPVRLRNLKHQREQGPIDESCTCPACRHSCGYIRHLFMANEMLGPILLTAHNLTYYMRLVADARHAIAIDQFATFFERKMSGWSMSGEPGFQS